MKKMLIALLLVCLMAMPFSAMAEAAADLPSLNWEDVAALVADVPGDFVSNEDLGVKFWLPDDLKPVELPQIDTDAFQMLNLYATEDGSASLGVSMSAMGDDIAAYCNLLAEEGGASDFEELWINGLYAISYEVAESDAAVVCFPRDDGTVLSFMMSPLSDEGFSALVAIMMASFQPAD